jgi:hypothetical protein
MTRASGVGVFIAAAERAGFDPKADVTTSAHVKVH